MLPEPNKHMGLLSLALEAIDKILLILRQNISKRQVFFIKWLKTVGKMFSS